MPDDAGEIDSAISGSIECLVDFLRMFAERRCRAGGVGRVMREREVLDHQSRCKPRFIVVVCRPSRYLTWHRTIGCQRPELSRPGRSSLEKRLVCKPGLLR